MPKIEKILEANATVTVRFLKRDGTVLEKLYERGAADAEEVSGLLRGEQQPLRGDKDGLALAHHVDDLVKDAVDLPREGHLLAVRPKEQARLYVTLKKTCQVEQMVEVFRGEGEVLVLASL